MANHVNESVRKAIEEAKVIWDKMRQQTINSKKLTADQKKMHLANMDLGEVSDSLRKMGANDLADKVDEIRVELFVNGPHNEVILKKETE